MSKEHKQAKQDTGRSRITRRRFLRAALLGGAGLLAGCVVNEVAREPAGYITPTPFRALASPLAPAQGTPQPVPEGSISLEAFMQFSSLLTGIDQLDPNLGRIYLSALEAGGGQGPGLAEVYGAASSGSGSLPQDLEGLSAGGFFEQEGFVKLADQVITMWYTGVYQDGEEEKVATFVDALAWKVLHFTKPPTICGQFGFWSQEPQVDISPAIQFTPAPTQPGSSGGSGG